MTAQALHKSSRAASWGLIYALIAVGLSLIFGLMDVVNFAHGEFLMLAMYATFGLVVLTHLDPIVLMPVVVAPCCSSSAAAPISGWCASPCGRRPTRAWCRSSRPSARDPAPGRGAIRLRHRLPQPCRARARRRTPRRRRRVPALAADLRRGDLARRLRRPAPADEPDRFGRALEATREDQGAVALVGIDPQPVFALGWASAPRWSPRRRRAGGVYYYIHPQSARASRSRLRHGGARRLRQRRRRPRRRHRGRARRSLHRRDPAAAMKSVGVYALYLAVVFVRPQGLFGRL